MTEGLFRKEKRPDQALAFAKRVVRLFSSVRSPFSDESISVRVGIAYGSVSTSVVGGLVPRMCLFGDVVVLASRLQTSADRNSIHCSADFREAAKTDGGSRSSGDDNGCEKSPAMKGIADPVKTYMYAAPNARNNSNSNNTGDGVVEKGEEGASSGYNVIEHGPETFLLTIESAMFSSGGRCRSISREW